MMKIQLKDLLLAEATLCLFALLLALVLENFTLANFGFCLAFIGSVTLVMKRPAYRAFFWIVGILAIVLGVFFILLDR